MKILIDTNIIVDVALQREPFLLNSEAVLIKVEEKQLEGYVSAATFSDIYYIINKTRGKDWTLTFLNRLYSFCQVAKVNTAVIEMALNSNFRDFEDAIQYSVAVINNLDVIVTRNPKDFPVSYPQILTPSQLIST
ncbi:MAG: PIN domain-containing protein [Crocosphaera sp.]|nr:PIN domain-containing protein [Crocosphaera sp.]